MIVDLFVVDQKKIKVLKAATKRVVLMKRLVLMLLLIQSYGAAVWWLSLLHNFIQQSLNSGSCAGSNPVRGVSEIRDGEDLRQWSRLEIRLNTFLPSTIPQKQFIIIIFIIIIIIIIIIINDLIAISPI